MSFNSSRVKHADDNDSLKEMSTTHSSDSTDDDDEATDNKVTRLLYYPIDMMTRRVAIANGTCNQPKAQFGYLTRVTPVCCLHPFCGWRHFATSRESKKAKAKAKAQVLGIAPLNMRSMCQRRFTIVEVVTDQHWL